MSTKFMDRNDEEQTAIASIDSLSGEGDLTLVAAAKVGNLQAFEVLFELTSKGFSSLRGA